MAQAASAKRDLIGETLLGKLRVIRLLGQGGMGAVYEVEHLITRHRRALKVLHEKHGASHDTVARFIREAGVAGTLRTPYVVETFDAGELEDGSPYVLMELLEGETLSRLIERADVPYGRMVGIACQVLEGLAVAHAAGIVHRDIKPENVFLTRDERGNERVKLLDFGISKFTSGGTDFAGSLTSEGAMMGTPYYMSPEQAAGAKEVDERTDLYSLGVMLYEGIAGVRPFDEQTLAALVIKIHNGDHLPLSRVAPDVPPGLAAVVERMLAVNRRDRWGSARELLSALVPFGDGAYVASLGTLQTGAVPGSQPMLRAEPGPRAVIASETVTRSEEDGLGLTVPVGAIASDTAEGARAARTRTIAVGVGAAVLIALVMAAAWWTSAGEPRASTAELGVGSGLGAESGAGSGSDVGSGSGAGSGSETAGSGSETVGTATASGSEPVVEPVRERPPAAERSGAGRTEPAEGTHTDEPPREEPQRPRRPERPEIERDNPYG